MPGISSPFNWLTNVDVVKDLWYSNAVWLLKINIQVGSLGIVLSIALKAVGS